MMSHAQLAAAFGALAQQGGSQHMSMASGQAGMAAIRILRISKTVKPFRLAPPSGSSESRSLVSENNYGSAIVELLVSSLFPFRPAHR